ncbi:RNA-binding protein [Halopiger djelfimassiliensis]|uniref:RNA-binding protein n=1 Tax=Halopiger djelfimassiliensis TaxID=1293047 RepID=UPI000677EF88|nr:RNA-binding protein [Halopiger djelfimassiliensis]
MLEVASVLFGTMVAVVFGSWAIKRYRGARSADRRESFERHRAAQQRDPPVDIGDVEAVGIHEFTEHHTGERQAVCKIEGFVVFVEDVPAHLEEGDVIRLKLLSFNRGRTSATATFLETA